MQNLNLRKYLEETKIKLLDILGEVEPVPGTQIQTGGVDSQLDPRGLGSEVDMADVEESADPNTRVTNEALGRKEHVAEYAA